MSGEPQDSALPQRSRAADLTEESGDTPLDLSTQQELDTFIAKLEIEVREAAKKFEFEKAAKLRDRVKEWTTFLQHLRGQESYVRGTHVIVTGDIADRDLFTPNDLVIQGNVSGSNLHAGSGTITVNNVRDSVLTAHRIIVTGTAINTKQIISPQSRITRPLPTKGKR